MHITFAKCVRGRARRMRPPTESDVKRQSRSRDVTIRDAMRMATRLETQEHRAEFKEV
jgi:hypothetical protein